MTTEGYRFETDLLREDAMEEENKWSLDKEKHRYKDVSQCV